MGKDGPHIVMIAGNTEGGEGCTVGSCQLRCLPLNLQEFRRLVRCRDPGKQLPPVNQVEHGADRIPGLHREKCRSPETGSCCCEFVKRVIHVSGPVAQESDPVKILDSDPAVLCRVAVKLVPQQGAGSSRFAEFRQDAGQIGLGQALLLLG